MAISLMSGLVGPKLASLSHERPLAWHLTILCFALAVPILILAAMLAWSYTDSERAHIEQSALRTAQQVMAAVDREFAGLIATDEVLALSRALQSDDLDSFDAQARQVYGQIGLNVVLRDRESQQVVNTRLPRGAGLPRSPDRESDPEVLKTKRPVISNLFIGAVSHKPQFSVNVPVLRKGEVVYFLTLSLTPERVRDIILQVPLPAGWTAAIVDRHGLVVAHSGRHEELLNQRLPGMPSQDADLNNAVRETDIASDHQPQLTAFSRSKLSGWVAAVTVPAYEAMAPLRNALISIIGIGGIILALSVALGLIFSQRIKGPVEALAAQAAEVGTGKELHPLATPIREVNALSQVLSKAARQRRDNEALLRANTAELQTVLDTVPALVWIAHDTECRSITGGRASYEFLRLPVGTNPSFTAPESERPVSFKVLANGRELLGEDLPVQRAAHGEAVHDYEMEVVFDDGTSRWIFGNAVPLLGENGQPRGAVSAFVETTDRKRAEQHLHALQLENLHASRLSAMGQMAAALAHELNQPLGAATNFLSAARLALKSARPDAPARALDRIDKAAEQAIRAGAILGRLRDYVARGETEKRIVSARQLLEDAVALALVGAKDAKIQVRFDFAPEASPILADRIQIQQVVFNLVRNALDATEGKVLKEIIVATRAVTEAEMEISVADNGHGLPQDPEAVFQPFATTKSTGTGIGLSVCRTIVEAHGGRLWAERRPGGGAVFRFTLPLAHSEEVVDG